MRDRTWSAGAYMAEFGSARELIAAVRSFSDRAQFIVVTHQKRTMEAADSLYGVSMGSDGISKVISRKLSGNGGPADADARVDAA